MSPRFNVDFEAVDEMLRGLLGSEPAALAANYNFDGGASSIWAMLALGPDRAFKCDPLAVTSCACAAEMLHNAYLVHCDVQIRDGMRHGELALLRRFDLAAAVGAGDLEISAAFACLPAHPVPASDVLFMHASRCATALGQADDVIAQISSSRGRNAIVAAKTGPLMALPVRFALFAAWMSDDGLNLKVGRNMSFVYQTLDDLNNLAADRAAGRISIYTVLETVVRSRFKAVMTARAEVRGAPAIACIIAGQLPQNVGAANYNLADRLDSTFTEFSHAA